ncbi:lipid A-modifier LpxR family protein [Roseobacteraceae bacterium NS-SX3]
MLKFAAALAALLLGPSAMLAAPAGTSSEPSQDGWEESWQAPGYAQRRRIGYGLIFSNDEIGDGKDRWRTGLLTSSRIWGYGWDGAAPAGFGDLIELRLQGQIIAPESLRNPRAGDRPYAGVVSAELHSHVQRGRSELSLGAGLVVTGPRTHLDDLQEALHEVIGGEEPSARLRAEQIPNKIRPVAVAEAGQTLDLGRAVTLRPFAEARAGDETLVRIGADFTFGRIGQGELLIRESVTGQRYRTVTGDVVPGLAFTLGGDIAHVAHSIYLPDGRGADLSRRRDRLRVGLHWQGQSVAAFYGLSYLGKEFDTQRESQLLGSIQVKLRF